MIYSSFRFVLERLFLAPGPKIFLQQYRARSGFKSDVTALPKCANKEISVSLLLFEI